MTIHELPIRLLQPEDLPLVQEFFGQMSEESAWFINRDHCNENMALGYLEGKHPNDLIWIAAEPTDSGEVIAGMVFLWKMHAGLPILGIGIRESWKGRRLGQRLIEFARDDLQSKDYGGIMLTTAQDNLRGQRLYERLGFEQIGTYKDGELLYLLLFPRPFECPIQTP